MTWLIALGLLIIGAIIRKWWLNRWRQRSVHAWKNVEMRLDGVPVDVEIVEWDLR